MKNILHYQIDLSPIGEIVVVSNGSFVAGVFFKDQKNILDSYKGVVKKSDETIEECFYQLKNYFSGKLTCFKIKTDFTGTDYTKSVHIAIQEHAVYGKVLSYSQLACLINRPSNYARSVAKACSKNKIQIVVGCHRIIAASGKLSGYAGEIWRKKYLLELEESVIKQQKGQSPF